MSAGVIVGIDGGATYSFGVAVDQRGNVLATARSGSLNFFGNSLASARAHLLELALSLKKDLPGGTVFNQVCIGCAALLIEATEDEKVLLCRDIFPLDRTRLVSDAVTAYQGACQSQPAVLIISGTGSIVLAKTETGKFLQVGGWGHLLGDAGSGFWIASEAVKAAIAAHDGLGPATSLPEWVGRWFKVEDLTGIIPTVYDAHFTKEKFAGLAKYLAENAASDRVLQEIFRRAGHELARLAMVPLKEMTSNPVPIFLEGSVVTNNRTVHESLVEDLLAVRPVKLEKAQLPPLLGAAGMALLHLGIGMDPFIVSNLRGTYRELLQKKVAS